VVRIFNVYFPVRSLVATVGDAGLVCSSFLLATVIQFGAASPDILSEHEGLLKILVITVATVVFLSWTDVYESELVLSQVNMTARLLMCIGLLAVVLAVLDAFFPFIALGKNVFLIGLLNLTIGLLLWRKFYWWLLRLPRLREPVYVLGDDPRTLQLVRSILNRAELGMRMVGYTDTSCRDSKPVQLELNRLVEFGSSGAIHRVILCMRDRRGSLPVQQLLDLRLSGVRIDDATALLEKNARKIELDGLYPSWFIFSNGFQLNKRFVFLLRVLSFVVASIALLICLPIVPFIILAIKFGSPGTVFYRQARVGLHGKLFYCYKFRTMRPDAEADVGPTWATDDDPRITRVGRFLRLTRLDEIPQLWNVVCGHMVFVGPRPERPEFVELLSHEIPFYGLRHVVRPGITGWAQVQYGYGNSVAAAREKLKYDLFYIKNISLGLDLFIMAKTLKVVVLGRGAK
jgi:sugar transferase (PEP-CTERM system associated)